MAGNTGSPGESVSTRLFKVLDAFDAGHRELSLTEIAARAALPISTTRRLVVELTRWGGLERLVDDRYRIGIRLWRIGVLAPQQRDLVAAARPLMQDLCSATRETVQVMVLDGQEALCIEKLSAESANPTATEVGERLPLYATAVGKCLLAFSPRDLLVQILDRGITRHTQYTVTQPGQLVRQLKEVRANGIAWSREEMTLGAVSVAAPIISGGVLRGAIGIVVRAPGQLDALAPAVRTASLSISRAVM
ncbi:regulatory protein [Mycolicibacterium smegmatis MKD8]|uniref:Regulatory protein n=1 Tax=Mycolicibacterium smegmatis (strain MKD8) TaxID=1214915 RepID=A0A2U9PI78_MYCSE|nr:regulatory protein [Mycolicibacterium smegmatis MKD8]